MFSSELLPPPASSSSAHRPERQAGAPSPREAPSDTRASGKGFQNKALSSFGFQNAFLNFLPSMHFITDSSKHNLNVAFIRDIIMSLDLKTKSFSFQTGSEKCSNFSGNSG